MPYETEQRYVEFVAKKISWHYIVWALGLTLVLRPWRNLAVQDDAVYAEFALELAQGNLILHPLIIAGSWPQALFGAMATWIFPLPGLASLMLLTWMVFLFCSFLLAKKGNVPPEVSLAYLSSPLFIQYGGTFLSETYAILGLVVLLLLTSQKSALKQQVFIFGVLLSTLWIVLQRQTLVAFPIFLGLMLWKKNPSMSKTLLVSSFFALLAYFLFPHTLLQEGYFGWWIGSWKQKGFSSVAIIFTNCLQQVCAIGLFLIPLIDFKFLKSKLGALLSLQGLVIALSLWSSNVPLSAGVLFTGYFPKVMGVTFLSFGVWGLSVIYKTWLQENTKIEVTAAIFAALSIIAFNGIVLVGDIKYSLPLSVPFFILATEYFPKDFSRGFVRSYLAIAVLVSIITNAYNLDTAEARWKLAEEIKKTSTGDVSAGYGHDLFYYGRLCTNAALQKILYSPSEERNQLMSTKVYGRAPRLYEDGWVAEFLIKPHRFFGKTMELKENRRPGQDTPPIRIMEYKSLGIFHALAVYKNNEGRKPWCFTTE